MSLGQDIDATNTKFKTICDDLRADIKLLWQNANAPSGLTNTGTPNIVSSSYPMDVRNQSATPQPIDRDTCWAQQSYTMPDPIGTHVPVDQQTFDFRYMTSNAMNQGASSNCTPRALERLINGLSEDVARWHGRGDINHAVKGCRMLTEDNLTSVGVLGEYYDTILESNDQMIGNNHFQSGPDTRGALKHPAWDRLLDTSSKGWMEIYKSLWHNSIYFGIVLTPFEAFIMKYSKRGDGLCLCGLGVNVTNKWDMPCLLSSNSYSPPATVSLKPSWSWWAMIVTTASSCCGFSRRDSSLCLTSQRNRHGRNGMTTSFAMQNVCLCTAT